MLERLKTIKLICQHLTPCLILGSHAWYTTRATQIIATILFQRRLCPQSDTRRCWCRRNNNSARGLGCRFVYILYNVLRSESVLLSESVVQNEKHLCTLYSLIVRLCVCVCVVYARIVPGAGGASAQCHNDILTRPFSCPS